MSKIVVDNLSYKYKNTKALSNVSFEVTDGLIGVIGANGAGKSTLMKLITTLLKIKDGDISIDGTSYKERIDKIRGQLGYLPQDFTVYKSITGRELLDVLATIKTNYTKKEKKAHLEDIIRDFDLEDYIDRKIKEYSGGMKQKLGFAQAIIGNPKVIVMDEPTVGLDPEQRNIIRGLFPIMSKGRIVFVTTHIVEDIEYYCNYLLVLNKGNLIFKGSKEDFIKEAKGYLCDVVMDIEDVMELKKQVKIISSIPSGDKIRVKYISKEKLSNDASAADISLQDAYMFHCDLYDEGLKNA
ncbi:ABC transporter ATP-binding protein [Clostridium brassicae]|uniref:ATP-binding cassette domain-containing protein n=1 Tax=Clostridium brassicae TaxID=2999072 RepID=A0ABT4DE24_9CLOT|nr:ATP-binding cassette domain-containing protein [Clostridium brassicae]MCY6960565.1 ATP-binding cassette domain-containing protein [Clostridium brassicae]